MGHKLTLTKVAKLAMVCGVAWYSSVASAAQIEARTGNAAVGAPAAPFTTTLLDGKEWQLKESGAAQVLVFTDSLCPYRHLPGCENTLEKLNGLYQQFSADSRWLTVVKEFYVTKEVVEDYVQRFNIKHPATWDQGNNIFSHYQVKNMPYVVVVDKQGNVAWRGDQVDESLTATLEGLR